jgi:hypothetical protein
MYNQPQWRDYEDFIAMMLRSCGWLNVKQCALGPDEGIDVTATAPDGFRKMLVQCKFYSNFVGTTHVQKLAGWVFRDSSFTDYILVTPNGFTEEAIHWAKSTPGNRLKLMTTNEFAHYIGFDVNKYVAKHGGSLGGGSSSSQLNTAVEFVSTMFQGCMIGIGLYLLYIIMYIGIFAFIIWFFVSCTYDALK